MRRLDFDLGSRLVPYREAWDLQRRVHGEVAAARRGPTLILVEHESVYTVGRRTHSWERPASNDVEGVPVIDVDRGGKTTWHGPGQLTVYPIVRLARPIDVIKYVRALEAAVMEVCAAYGVGTRRVAGRSGVWVPADAAGPTAPGSPP
ncbi:lipoyl(octanoyl) transferase LipB, partial [Actinomyces dentalis]|uniref:lipoyl(octanoyl) transferase LipB n=1 Tax=Actinomyces dentalis TaxID=272548 RepID=UPI0028E2BF9F